MKKQMAISVPVLAGLFLITAAAAWTSQEPHKNDPAPLLKALAGSKHSLAEGVRLLSKGDEAAISAKFEFDDSGHLSLSVYTVEKGLAVDAEHNVLKEYAGSPEQAAWTPEAEVFKDVAHVARASQQLTLMALSQDTLQDVLAKAEKENGGQVISITPVLRDRAPFLTVEVASGGRVVEAKYKLRHREEEEEDEDEGR